MRIKALLVLILATALTVLMLIWVEPVIGARNSICEQQPHWANCR